MHPRYGWFWRMGDQIPFADYDRGAVHYNYTVPSAFYPEWECPLGAPLGPPAQPDAKAKPTVWARKCPAGLPKTEQIYTVTYFAYLV